MTIDTGTERMLAHVEGGIGWMTYNNPARLNAMSYDMQVAVPLILGAFAADPDVHVVVVRGAGDRAFVSGADISEFSEKRTTVAARGDYDDALAAAWGSWGLVDKPVIAMIRGYCIGGGLLTAMKSDIRIASDDSQFGVPAAKLGLGYAYGGVEELMSLVGPSWTSEILSRPGGWTPTRPSGSVWSTAWSPSTRWRRPCANSRVRSPRTRRSR